VALSVWDQWWEMAIYMGGVWPERLVSPLLRLQPTLRNRASRTCRCTTWSPTWDGMSVLLVLTATEAAREAGLRRERLASTLLRLHPTLRSRASRTCRCTTWLLTWGAMSVLLVLMATQTATRRVLVHERVHKRGDTVSVRAVSVLMPVPVPAVVLEAAREAVQVAAPREMLAVARLTTPVAAQQAVRVAVRVVSREATRKVAAVAVLEAARALLPALFCTRLGLFRKAQRLRR